MVERAAAEPPPQRASSSEKKTLHDNRPANRAGRAGSVNRPDITAWERRWLGAGSVRLQGNAQAGGASASSAAGASSIGASAGVTCAQPSANCQSPKNTDALNSDRITFNTADDFRPGASGSVTQLCWWGTYGRAGAGGGLSDCYLAGVTVDSFRVRLCADANGVPDETTCSTFSQSAGTLSVVGPTATGLQIAGFLPEFAYTATLTPGFSVTAGTCYWIEITNDSGTCTWFWEVSNTGDDWSMQDGVGDGITPPDGYVVSEFVLRDLAFCLDVSLDQTNACGPPTLAACPGTTDCCVAGPPNPPGCSNELCCERVCACDPDCCTAGIGWDQFCSTTGLSANGCGADILCAETCSVCGDVDAGDCCAANATPSCSDTACCDAVCAFDSFCCESGSRWDSNCAAEAATLCPSTCSPNPCGNPSAGSCCEDNGTPGCDDAACCEAVCAQDLFCCDSMWDVNCGLVNTYVPGADALHLCRDTCGCSNLCGDIDGDGSANVADFVLFANCFGLTPTTSPACRCSDLNGDGVINLDDHAIFAGLMTTPSTNMPPDCP